MAARGALSLLAGCAVALAAPAAPPALPQLIIDQAGSTPAAFPYGDLHRWGVRQVVAGSLDCSSTLDGVPGGPWYDSAGLALVAKEVATNRAAIAAAHADGMQIFLSSDLFQFPTRLLARYQGNVTWPGSECFGYTRGPTCIDLRANATRVFLRVLFDEVVTTFPDLDGVVLRYGENSPCNEHQGNAPYNIADPISSLQLLLQFVRAGDGGVVGGVLPENVPSGGSVRHTGGRGRAHAQVPQWVCGGERP
jgi:hypothetical protein